MDLAKGVKDIGSTAVSTHPVDREPHCPRINKLTSPFLMHNVDPMGPQAVFEEIKPPFSRNQTSPWLHTRQLGLTLISGTLEKSFASFHGRAINAVALMLRR